MQFIVSPKPKLNGTAGDLSKILAEVKAVVPPEAVLYALDSVSMIVISCPDSYDANVIRRQVANCPGVEDIIDDFDLEPTPVRVENPLREGMHEDPGTQSSFW